MTARSAKVAAKAVRATGTVLLILEDGTESDANASLKGWTPGQVGVQPARATWVPTRLCPHGLAGPTLHQESAKIPDRTTVKSLQQGIDTPHYKCRSRVGSWPEADRALGIRHSGDPLHSSIPAWQSRT